VSLGAGGEAASLVLNAVAVGGTQHGRSTLPRQLQRATGGAPQLLCFFLQENLVILRALAELFSLGWAGAGVGVVVGGLVKVLCHVGVSMCQSAVLQICQSAVSSPAQSGSQQFCQICQSVLSSLPVSSPDKSASQKFCPVCQSVV